MNTDLTKTLKDILDRAEATIKEKNEEIKKLKVEVEVLKYHMNRDILPSAEKAVSEALERGYF
jgi:predicted  nucleic acid-binding Zn-ribbon protein